MLLSTQTSHIFKTFGEKEGISILKRAGYDALDLTLTRLSRESADSYIFSGDGAISYAEQVKKWAQDEGIIFAQGHTPFDFVWSDPNEFEERFVPLTVKALEICAAVGAKIVVVHPFNYGDNGNNSEEIFDINMKLYRRLIPVAKDLGIKIALENLFRDGKDGAFLPSACGTIESFIRYVDTLDSEYIVGCLDLGHASIVGIEPQDFIRALGHDRLKALHVHDNSYKTDGHTLPGLGKMDWEEITRALAEIDYDGNFNYEADNFMKGFDDDFKPTACRFMADRGRHLIKKIESYK